MCLRALGCAQSSLDFVHNAQMPYPEWPTLQAVYQSLAGRRAESAAVEGAATSGWTMALTRGLEASTESPLPGYAASSTELVTTEGSCEYLILPCCACKAPHHFACVD